MDYRVALFLLRRRWPIFLSKLFFPHIYSNVLLLFIIFIYFTKAALSLSQLYEHFYQISLRHILADVKGASAGFIDFHPVYLSVLYCFISVQPLSAATV